MRKGENVGRNCDIFFLVFTDYRFSMFIFLKAVFFTVRSHLSFPLGCSFLLSLIVMKLDLYRWKKKSSINFSDVCIGWTE